MLLVRLLVNSKLSVVKSKVIRGFSTAWEVGTPNFLEGHMYYTHTHAYVYTYTHIFHFILT